MAAEDRQTLKEYLETWRRAMTETARGLGLVYAGGADFVLQHGTWYDAPGPLTLPERGLPRMCYGNAIVMAVKRPELAYCEGYALAPDFGMPFDHAWNVTAAGELVDITWCNGGLAYVGCVFSIERADDATWYGDASVLDDWKRRWPILRQRWEGERPLPPDYVPSPALRLSRRAAARGKLLAKGKAYADDTR